MAQASRPATAEERRLAHDCVAALLADHDPTSLPPASFWGARFDRGLAWVSFPEGLGGSGWEPSLQPLVDKELRAAGAPQNWARNPIGIGVAAPAIVAWGADEQKHRYLRPLFTCEEVWCQLFSEPGAGSDLAGLATTATRDGDEWVVTGRKVWVSLAHMARWGLLLARTDPDQPKHRGITCFVVDLTAEGVEVRPIRQMTGDAEFDEVVLTSLRVPDGNRLGGVGQGWEVAMTTLGQERVAIGDLAAIRGPAAIDQALRLWRELDDKGPALADDLMRLWVEAEAVRLTSLRAHEAPVGVIAKLAFAELNQRIHEFCLTLLGPAGLLYDGYEMSQPDEMNTAAGDPRKAFLRSPASTMEAGTSDILRTLLGERVLGLPPEPRVDTNRPWSEVPRG